MLNIAVIMGRLTAAPELRTTPNGVSVTSFSVAVDRSYSSRSGGVIRKLASRESSF